MSSPRDLDRSDPDGIAPIVELLRAAVRATASAGRWSVTAAVDGIDHAVEPLLGRRVRSALDLGAVGPDRGDLERALRAARSRPLGGKLTNSAVPRIARRLAPVRAATRRSPVGMALWVGPGLVEAVTSGLREIDAVTAHLGARARRAGGVPDPDAIHTAVVAALGGERPAPRPGDEPDHRAMLGRWLRAAVASVVPFGLADRPDAIEDIADRLDHIDDEALGVPRRR